MAKHFGIDMQRSNGTLHLKLTGDFDGSSAYELLHILEKSCNGVSRIFIYTSSLRCIHPFARHIFVTKLNAMSKKFMEFGLMGDNARELVLGHSDSKASLISRE